jgi:hypothetical protein
MAISEATLDLIRAKMAKLKVPTAHSLVYKVRAQRATLLISGNCALSRFCWLLFPASYCCCTSGCHRKQNCPHAGWIEIHDVPPPMKPSSYVCQHPAATFACFFAAIIRIPGFHQLVGVEARKSASMIPYLIRCFSLMRERGLQVLRVAGVRKLHENDCCFLHSQNLVNQSLTQDECMFSFDTPFSTGGIAVNLTTWQGFGSSIARYLLSISVKITPTCDAKSEHSKFIEVRNSTLVHKSCCCSSSTLPCLNLNPFFLPTTALNIQ